VQQKKNLGRNKLQFPINNKKILSDEI
jgi:hypothetical protein